MRRTLLALLLAVSLPAFAQQPAGLEPIPEPPPMPAGMSELDEPEVTIVQRGEDTVAEYRIRGKLYMVKVTPPHGVPYYLIDKEGNGQMVRDDAAPGLAVPMWVIKSW
ncbi:DUF2782 domain-containing protein [Thauera mechernichensis]|uniref:DUF2782 domain-containing protein n=1 Tax=Thauera mechernichensis TaxID=82788 RepID=A0ABW3WDH9_9RHOO|nr:MULTISPECIES: DUF2782 domain-containing protein [Thauera]HAY08794.1 DUF2782 domain-containing protein [Thauera sp.]ENO77380.1 hypothetical protein B447_15686 [Thauera sp. 27]ENO91008.1 hypothetical protein C662_18558 [Thauera sp. 28]MDG3065652.1 DUF2782 domain-containing protein [Thauera mechernichensis]HRJ25110.1 DUF2782 domain-containing protein [Thauera sp.]